MTTDYRKQAEDFAEYLLTLPKGRRRRAGEVVRGNCPKEDHPDKHPSFSFDIEKDAYACSCGSGKGSDLRAHLRWGEPVGIAIPVVHKPRPVGEPDVIHTYGNGNRKLRWYRADGSKVIAWEHWEGVSSDAEDGAWVPGKSGEVGLYNEHLLGDEGSTDLILLSESETDCDALTDLGYVAVCHGFGAGVAVTDVKAALFHHKRTAILEHADEPGRKWAKNCLGVLLAAGADAWVVSMPEGSKDIRDYINSGADKAIVDLLIRGSEPTDLVAEKSGDLFGRTPDTISYIIDPLLSWGCILQIQGNPKGGKSCFALMLALACSVGRWMAGRLSFEGGPRRTLFISYEDSARRLKRRARNYLDAMGFQDAFPPNLLLFQRPPDLDLATPDGRAQLEKIIRVNRAEVLVIDTLSWVACGDENSKKDMQPVMSTLRFVADVYGTAIVLLHHTRKTGQAGDMASTSERGRGSSAIAAAADSILDWGKRISPNHTLCHFISKDTDEDEFIVWYKPNPDGSIGWALEEVVEREDSLELQTRILDAVQKLSITTTEITPSLIHQTMRDVSINTVRGHISSLVEKSKLKVSDTRGPRGARYYKL